MRKIEQKQRNNTKRKLYLIVIAILAIVVCALIYLYKSNEYVKNFMDVYFFNRDVTDEDTTIIKLDSDKSNQVFVYGKYIAVLNDKNLDLYDSYGQQVDKINININTALYDSNNRYLVVGENGGNEVCLILDKTYLWSNTIGEEILQVHVNSNGYVAVVSSDSTHKSIMTVFNSSGVQLFKSYFSSTTIVDASISEDNKYIAIGEIDTSGMVIKSNIKVVSVDNAQNDTENAIVYTYNAENNKLIISVKYQNENQIACLYDTSIDVIKNNENKELFTVNSDNVTFVSADFNNQIAYIEEEKVALFKSNSKIKIINTNNEAECSYEVDEIVKDIYVQDNILAINVGAELYFFNTNGHLIKKYVGNREITNVILSKNIATVIYKDKIVVIEL